MIDIGFIGLGVMGRPMAERLIRSGHRVHLWRVKKHSVALLSLGGIEASSAREAAEKSQILFLMLPDTLDVESVLFGVDGVESALGSGKLIVDMSSISPDATVSFANRVGKLHCGYLDAPVSGGERGAKSGGLTIMVGGSTEDFDRAKPLLEVLGRSINHIGGVGRGQVAKIANQIIVALTIQAVSEAMLFAKRADADPVKVREALLGGLASSRVLEEHGQRILEERFDPGFRIALHRKDIGLALSAAAANDVSLPCTGVIQQLMNAAVAQGEGDSDHSALYRSLSRLNGDETADGGHGVP